MFDQRVRTLVVVGAQWGDEGKGKLVDVLAEGADWVVRYQGGANAGHTVHIGDVSTVLHQIPSGILHPGVRCAIGNGVVLDPDTLFHEIDELVGDGVDVEGRLYVSDRAHLVLPYHKLVDAESAASRAIGTTGRGIGPAYEDKVARRGVRVLDLRHPDRLRALVEKGAAHADAQLAAQGSERRVDVEATLELLGRLAPRLLPLAEDVGLHVHRAIRSGAAVLLEGAQGSLLDVDHGTYPYVTSSSTTSGGAAIGVGIAPTAIDAVLGVVKAYTTRVGNGPLPTEIAGPLGEEVRRLGNEFGATTGRARRCGWFDAVVVRYATRVNGLTGLAITKLDVLDTLDQIALCVGYEVDGELHTEFPGDLAALERATPRYEWFAGWRRPTSGARALAELPAEARAYLDRVQELVEAPIAYVSVGTRRDQIIGVEPGSGAGNRESGLPNDSDSRCPPPGSRASESGMGEESVDVLVVGAGPCGLAAAIACGQAGLKAVVLDRGCLVSGVASYPPYMTFFSTAERIAIGGVPFAVAGEKPTRRDALAYYRVVARHFGLDVRQYQTVTAVAPLAGAGAARFLVRAEHRGAERRYRARAVVVATGYFGTPSPLGVPGEELPHVSHYFDEGHYGFDNDVVVVGGGNSAVDATLELHRAGARVTMVHFGSGLDPNIKPWVLPDISARLREGAVRGVWNARVAEITPDAVHVAVGEHGDPREALAAGAEARGVEHRAIPADLVYLTTGFLPNSGLLTALGVPLDAERGIPAHDPATMETSVPGVYIAGVIASGFHANRIFIENGRDHGAYIARHLTGVTLPTYGALPGAAEAAGRAA